MADIAPQSTPYNIHHFATLPSAQDKAAKLLLQNQAGHGCVITCDEQTQGRGRYERPWQSISGNLFLSLIIKPQCDVRNFPHLAFVTSLSLAQTIKRYIIHNQDVRIKWSNDVLIDAQKAAGILIETQQHKSHTYAIIGIGVNVISAPEGFGSIGENTCKQAVQNTLLKSLNENLALWNDGSGWDVVRNNWQEYALDLGTHITTTFHGQKENGVYRGINAQGHLLFGDETGMIRTITGGDVSLINERPE